MTSRIQTRTKGALLFAFALLAIASYYFSFANFRKLNAEIEIQRWADRLIDQGGIGRNCAVVNYSDVNRVLESMGRKRLEKDFSMVDFPMRCWKDMKLSQMTYYADYNVVSGVYRCEKDGMVQELQLAIYLEPRSVPQEDDCKVGTFPQSWNLPIGEATKFSLP